MGEKSAPLGWREEDRNDPLFSWLWSSEWWNNNGNRISSTSRSPTVVNLIDFSSPFVQTSWEAEYMMVVTTDGLYGTASSLEGSFTQWIRMGNPSTTEWGNGVVVNNNPNFR